MKKFIALFVAAMLFALCAMSVSVSAEEAPFKISVSGAAAVTAGETAEFTVSVKDINIKSADDSYSDGLGSINMVLKFDTAFFDASTMKVTCPEIENWVIECVDADKESGRVVITAMGDPVQGKIATVTKNGVLDFKVSVKVKADAVVSDGAEIYIDGSDIDTYGSDGGSYEVTGFECGSLDVDLIKKLPSPESLTLEDGHAKWNPVEGADSYIIQVYKDGEALGKPLTATETSYDLTTLIKNNLGGKYSFTVYAKSGSELFKDGDAATSNEYKYRGTLSKPTIKLTVDKIKGVVNFTITDDNPEDSVSTYIVKVYDKNGDAKEITTSKLTGTISGLKFGDKYNVTVEANSASLSDVETGNLSSGESNKVSVTADGIIGISVSKKPELSYTEGDTIDLSNMQITVDFAVASNVKISRSKFSEYGITTNPKHGADVILSFDGKSITVSCGDIKVSEELVLSVKSGQCEHATTEPEHKDADCGNDGYDKVVCTVCGATVEEKVIPATGEHDFGDWEWKSKPTVNVDGVRNRVCKNCGKEEHQQITYAEYLAMSTSDTTTPPTTTNPPDTTTGDETDPPVTSGTRKNNALGGVVDLGKLFLLALVMILIVIVIFIISAVYMESRRNRRRRSRSRTNQSRNNQRRNNYRR